MGSALTASIMLCMSPAHRAGRPSSAADSACAAPFSNGWHAPAPAQRRKTLMQHRPAYYAAGSFVTPQCSLQALNPCWAKEAPVLVASAATVASVDHRRTAASVATTVSSITCPAPVSWSGLFCAELVLLALELSTCLVKVSHVHTALCEGRVPASTRTQAQSRADGKLGTTCHGARGDKRPSTHAAAC